MGLPTKIESILVGIKPKLPVELCQVITSMSTAAILDIKITSVLAYAGKRFYNLTSCESMHEYLSSNVWSGHELKEIVNGEINATWMTIEKLGDGAMFYMGEIAALHAKNVDPAFPKLEYGDKKEQTAKRDDLTDLLKVAGNLTMDSGQEQEYDQVSEMAILKRMDSFKKLLSAYDHKFEKVSKDLKGIKLGQARSIPGLYILIPHEHDGLNPIARLMFKIKSNFVTTFTVKVLCESERPHLTNHSGFEVVENTQLFTRLLPVLEFTLSAVSCATQGAVGVSLDFLSESLSKQHRSDLTAARCTAESLKVGMSHEKIDFTAAGVEKSRNELYEMLSSKGATKNEMMADLELIQREEGGFRYLCKKCVAEMS